MTMNNSKWMDDFNELVIWSKKLHKISDEAWLQPISEGKWSIAEIISHLHAWDCFILDERLNKINKEVVPLTPNVEEINQQASKHARSGMNKEVVINELVKSREAIMIYLKSFKPAELEAPLQIGKNKISLKEYIIGLTEHDRHHIKQMKEFIDRVGIIV